MTYGHQGEEPQDYRHHHGHSDEELEVQTKSLSGLQKNWKPYYGIGPAIINNDSPNVEKFGHRGEEPTHYMPKYYTAPNGQLYQFEGGVGPAILEQDPRVQSYGHRGERPSNLPDYSDEDEEVESCESDDEEEPREVKGVWRNGPFKSTRAAKRQGQDAPDVEFQFPRGFHGHGPVVPINRLDGEDHHVQSYMREPASEHIRFGHRGENPMYDQNGNKIDWERIS